MDDELQELRDNFFCGNYSRTLELADEIDTNNKAWLADEKLSYVARTYLSQGQLDKIKGLQSSSIPGQQATAFKTVHQRSKEGSKKQQALERLLELAKQSNDQNAMALACAALASEGDFEKALELSANSQTPELLAQRVQFFVMMNRVDLAETEFKKLKSIAGDCTVVNMAECIKLLATGKFQEAYLMFCDLSDQFVLNEDDPAQASATLLCGKGVANMQRGMFEEAMADLVKAAQTDAGRPETLVNTICCNAHSGDHDAFNTNMKQFKDAFPSHPLVGKLDECNAAFVGFRPVQ